MTRKSSVPLWLIFFRRHAGFDLGFHYMSSIRVDQPKSRAPSPSAV
jgi:hypothetical protein